MKGYPSVLKNIETFTSGDTGLLEENKHHQSLNSETLRQAVARGWCSCQNSHKRFDPDLAEAIVKEVQSCIEKSRGGEE